jgi:peroxiredoxin Q/BCP
MRLPATLTGALSALGLLALAGGATLTAGDKGKAMPKVGDKAPAFEGTDENGKAWKSGEHVGKKVLVVYFFPAALTGG